MESERKLPAKSISSKLRKYKNFKEISVTFGKRTKLLLILFMSVCIVQKL